MHAVLSNNHTTLTFHSQWFQWKKTLALVQLSRDGFFQPSQLDIWRLKFWYAFFFFFVCGLKMRSFYFIKVNEKKFERIALMQSNFDYFNDESIIDFFYFHYSSPWKKKRYKIQFPKFQMIYISFNNSKQGGFLASRFERKLLFLSVFLSSLCLLVTPFIAQSFELLMINRILMGTFSGKILVFFQEKLIDFTFLLMFI